MASKKMRIVKHQYARRVKHQHERAIITDYFAADGKTVIKRTWSMYVTSAVSNVVKHMLENKYVSWSAVVYNDWTGEEYRTVKHSVTGRIAIV